MTTATVTSKGQITIPWEVRRALKVEMGDQVEFVEVQSGQFLMMTVNRSVTELKGMFGKAKKIVSIDAMNEAIRNQGASAK